FRVSTGDGCLEILELQLEGKKMMNSEQFLRGYKIKSGTKLG
ncbi:MAG: methionyl-tRNA formyltransferase, partial [Calditrichaeota bacterium]|nr:methionyl-tRNA formyltransferase [Calditrichota bacterium]